MDYRALTVSAILATGLAGLAPICRADIVASEDGIAVRDAGVAAPARGMTMTQVAGKFGDPVTKVPAVGKPPISRWEYSGFVVYFERDHVIHSVVSAGAESPGAESPAAASTPPAPAPAPAAPVESPAASSLPAASSSSAAASSSSAASSLPAASSSPSASSAPAESQAPPST
jgi:hypothetical protein